MKILISDAFDPNLPSKLALFGEVTENAAELADADVVLVRSKTKCTKEYIDSAPKLKLIIRGGVGVDNIDVKYAESKGITVRNTPKASSIAVAELAFAMMIAVPCKVVEAHTGMKEGKFLKELKRTELFGKTLCLVGLGNIASEVAKRATAFGMRVQGYDKFIKQHPHAKACMTLEEAITGADYISLHLPLTDETRGIVNEELISKMKKGVVIINTGRGPCVDTDSMLKALNDGRVGTYATDVWPKDPPAEDFPLLKAPNMLMLPHLGANTKENLLRIGEEVMSIIGEFTQGAK